MATNWTVLGGGDLRKVISIGVETDANESTDPNTPAGTPLDAGGANRRDDLVALAVQEFRAAVRQAGRVALSVTASAVSPDAVRHVLVSAAYQLIVSTPNLKMFVITDKGISSPYSQLYKEAQEFLKGVREGRVCPTPPSDPTGQDWTTAVSTTNPALIGAVNWGDLVADAKDYTAGSVTLTGGGSLTLPADDMTTYDL